MENLNYRARGLDEEEAFDTSVLYSDIERLFAKYEYGVEQNKKSQTNLNPISTSGNAMTIPNSTETPPKKSFRDTMQERMDRLRQVKAQDKQAIKILTSPEFIQGETIVHAVQIGYLKDLIKVTENLELKAKLITRLFKVKQSFQALQAYERYIDEMKHQWDGGWAFNKKVGKIFGAFYGGVFSAVGGVFYSAINHLGVDALPIMAGTFGAGVVGKLAIDEIAKFRLNRKFNETLRKFIDLNSLADNQELLDYLNRFSAAEIHYQKTLEHFAGIREDSN